MSAIAQATDQKPSNTALLAIVGIASLVMLPIVGFIISIIHLVCLLADTCVALRRRSSEHVRQKTASAAAPPRYAASAPRG
jgi:hypothetical protein